MEKIRDRPIFASSVPKELIQFLSFGTPRPTAGASNGCRSPAEEWFSPEVADPGVWVPLIQSHTEDRIFREKPKPNRTADNGKQAAR